MTANAVGMPKLADRRAPRARADARAMLKVIEFSETAVGRSSRRHERGDERLLRRASRTRSRARSASARRSRRRAAWPSERERSRARRWRRPSTLLHREQRASAGRSGRRRCPSTARGSRIGANWQKLSTPSSSSECGQPVDEQRRGEVLEPGAAGRDGVAEEERPEVALSDDAEDRARAGELLPPPRRSRPARLVQLRVDRPRRLRRARPGTPSSSSWVAASDPLGRAEVAQQRAPPRRADALELVEHRLARPRVAPLAVEADGEAVRLVADALQELQARRVLRSSRIGSGRPGTKTSSTRFASAITATRGRSYACIAASAAASWPLPPSITTRFGVAANDSS